MSLVTENIKIAGMLKIGTITDFIDDEENDIPYSFYHANGLHDIYFDEEFDLSAILPDFEFSYHEILGVTYTLVVTEGDNDSYGPHVSLNTHSFANVQEQYKFKSIDANNIALDDTEARDHLFYGLVVRLYDENDEVVSDAHMFLRSLRREYHKPWFMGFHWSHGTALRDAEGWIDYRFEPFGIPPENTVNIKSSASVAFYASNLFETNQPYRINKFTGEEYVSSDFEEIRDQLSVSGWTETYSGMPNNPIYCSPQILPSGNYTYGPDLCIQGSSSGYGTITVTDGTHSATYTLLQSPTS